MSDCYAAPALMPFETAMAQMLASITPVSESQLVPIQAARHAVLAQDILSPVNVPPLHNSAMDGYAFAAQSLQNSKCLQLAGKSFAGAPYQDVCLPGQCIRIMTGAKIPQGCDSVEMQENCIADGERITFTKQKPLGSHVRLMGEDITIGQHVFTRGHRLTAIDLGILASLGIAHVPVYRKLNVALIATGDELKAPGQTLNDGDIYQSNGYVLAAMLNKLNVNVIDFGVIEDDFQAIKQAFEQADQQADAIISTGGVSVGEADHVKPVLEELGNIEFWKIAMKPGKPFAFGQLPNSIFFGLPGNPVSAVVTAHQLALPGLVKLQNCAPLERTYLLLKTTMDIVKSPGRMDLQRGIISTNEQGESVVTHTGAQGSGILSSLSQANCYIVLPAEQGRVKAGALVRVQLFDQYLQ